jgi:hypothetical protein
MSGRDDIRLDDCFCCESGPEVPAIDNRPGLPALDYRLATHGQFLERMLRRVGGQSFDDGIGAGLRPLEPLKTRRLDDPAIALLDAAAVVGDVLTFYQERIANEGFLRTATERLSVRLLARAIGYQLNPGVAATAYLHFTVDTAPGAPGHALVPAGTKVQSVPPQDKLPQTFETVEAIEARAEWNAIAVRATRPQQLGIAGGKLYLLGADGSLQSGAPGVEDLAVGSLFVVGDVALPEGAATVPAYELSEFYLEGTDTRLAAGDRLLVVGHSADGGDPKTDTLVLRLTDVDEEIAAPPGVTDESAPPFDRTRVAFAEKKAPPPFFLTFSLVPTTFSVATVPLTGSAVSASILGQSWREKDLNAFLSYNRWGRGNLVRHVAVVRKPPPLPPSEGVFGFDDRLGAFGHNAPKWESLPKHDTANLQGNPYPNNWDAGSGWPIWKNPGISPAPFWTGADMYLERAQSEIVPGGWVVLETASGLAEAYRVRDAVEKSAVGFAVSAKCTGLELASETGDALDDAAKNASFTTRDTTVHAVSRQRKLAPLPIDEPLTAGSEKVPLAEMVLGLGSGRKMILTGERHDLDGIVDHEVIEVVEAVHDGGFTTLALKSGLLHPYKRRSVRLSANVAKATHGETVHEPLGNGDGARKNQTFALKKPPLTYVSASTPSGGESTLCVEVNGIKWEEAPALFPLGPKDQAYITRIEEDGGVHVIFGNGERGARLPTGTTNVAATYRSGIGPDGDVDANTLTILQSKPLGIRSAVNPLAAGGSQAPESVSDARANAPLKVLTLERIVSLKDFADFARAFSGIGKAEAVSVWNGAQRLIHVTVAESDGDVIDEKSDLFQNLKRSIDDARDPIQSVEVAGHKPLLFNVEASLVIDPRYRAEDVLAAAETAVAGRFSFANRAFAQPVTAAEITALLDGTDGVIAADLDKLYLVTDPDGPLQTRPPAMLAARPARWEQGAVAPAELLLLAPAGALLTEAT